MGEGPIEPDYGSDAFTVRREPLQDIIQSLSSLYLDPVLEGEEGEELTVLPPPIEEDESLISMVITSRVSLWNLKSVP